MKTLHPILAALALVVFAACQVPSGGTGTLKISLPAASRATQADVSGRGEKVRLQLVRSGITVPLSGRDFLEESLSGQTLALDGLPTGTNYRLYAATGTKTADGTFFQVAYYQVSEPFEISSGVETAVGLTLSRTPIHLLTSGPHSNASVGVGTRLYQTDSVGYRYWDSITTSSSLLTASSAWSGKTLHSLDKSSTGVFLNTSTGLGTGTSGSATFPGMTNSDSVAITPNVTKSGSLATGTHTLDVFAGTGLTAGLRITGGSNQNWYDLNSLLKVDTLPETVKESLSKSEGLFRDFVATSHFAYIATALGTYRVDTDMVNNQDPTALGETFIDRDESVVLTAALDGRTQFIQSVSAFRAAAVANGVAFAGTSRGLFSGVTNGVGVPGSRLGLVEGTYGLDIQGLCTTATPFASKVYTAAYSANTKEILIFTGTGTLVARYPGLAGLPTGPLSLSWWTPGGADLKLVVSGANGTVFIDVAHDPNPPV